MVAYDVHVVVNNNVRAHFWRWHLFNTTIMLIIKFVSKLSNIDANRQSCCSWPTAGRHNERILWRHHRRSEASICMQSAFIGETFKRRWILIKKERFFLLNTWRLLVVWCENSSIYRKLKYKWTLKISRLVLIEIELYAIDMRH